MRLRDIREAIARPHVKVVSFDVFDTLLVRPVFKPTDLFYLVNERILEDCALPDIAFMELRPWAEKTARARVRQISPHYDDITLDEIYDVIAEKCGLSHHESNRIKQIEIDIELQYLSARKSMKAIYDYAISLGKRVVIASDIYLPASVLIEALSRNGYNRIERYFVSSELRLGKGSGNLYPRILRDLDVKPHEIIHIGDNARADVERAKKHKIEAFHFPKTSEMMETGRTDWSIWKNRIEHAEPGCRLLQGMIYNELFDTLPREGYEKNSLFNGNPYMLGYYGVGPFLLALTQWLLQEATARGHEVIGFIARDGWLPKQAYDLLRPYYPEAPPAVYFRISRSTCYPFDVTNAAQLMFSDKKMHIERSLSSRQVVESRLFTTIDEDFAEHFKANGIILDEKCSDFQELFHVASSYKGNIFAGLEEHRAIAEDFYRDIFKNYKKVAVFDCGYSGRAQRVLRKILPNEIFGYYIMSFDSIRALDKEKLPYANFLGQPFNRKIDPEPIVTAIIELLISEYNIGSILGFTKKNGTIETVIEKEQYDLKTVRLLNAIHTGSLDFIRAVISTFGSDVRHLNVTPSTASLLLRQFMLAPHAKDAAIFENIQFSNGMTGEVRKIIAESEIRSKWQEGYRALRTPPAAAQTPSAPASFVKQSHAPAAQKPAVQKVGKNIVYMGRDFPARINDMRVMPAIDFLEGVALLTNQPPSQDLRERCRHIVRNKSKWLAAAVLLKETGGIWKSKIDIRDKFIAHGYLLSHGKID